MTTERLRRRLDALAPADSWPTVWHEIVTPKDNMTGEEYAAWERAALAAIPPGDGVIINRIVSPAGCHEGGGA
jgi:hypothetical protein